jgi:hypothetical protein
MEINKMGKLDYFKIEMKPMHYIGLHGGEEKVYSITAQINGIKHQTERVMPPPPYMSEIEFLTLMAIEIRDTLTRYELSDTNPNGDKR